MAKHRSGESAALAVLALGIVVAFPSCATKRAESELSRAAAPRARIEAGEALALDRYRTRLPLSLELDNPSSTPLSIESYECSLIVAGVEAGRVEDSEPRLLEAGGSLSLPFEFIADARELGGSASSPEGPAEAEFSVEARIAFRDERGGRTEARAKAEGSFPLVREPRLKILSLKIERDILVTTKLRLVVEVDNPNAFPIELGSFGYVFDGEGKPWAEGSAAGPFAVGARSSGKIGLAFEMNFADRDRELFDLVAKLGVLRYRLAGSASVAARPGLPLSFPLEFDEAGSCRVER